MDVSIPVLVILCVITVLSGIMCCGKICLGECRVHAEPIADSRVTVEKDVENNNVVLVEEPDGKMNLGVHGTP